MADNNKQKAKAPRKQIDFIVTTSNPNDASSAKANKKRVRSVAALKSWPERRKKMFEQLENGGTGHGAFLVDEHGQDPKPTNRQVAAPRAWPERRTKAFQRVEGSSADYGEFITEKPEQAIQWPQQAPQDLQPVQSSSMGYGDFFLDIPEQPYQWVQQNPPEIPEQPYELIQQTPLERLEQPVQWIQPPPPAYIPSNAAAPRVPPGFMDSSPRYVPFGMIPDRTTPPRNRQASESSSSSSFVPATPASSLMLYRSTAAQLPPPLPSKPEIHASGSNPPCSCVHCQPKKSVVLSKKKRMVDGSDKALRHDNGGMVLLTPPASPHTDAARGRADPFNCYSVEWQPWFDQILHHMMAVYAPRGWPALRITQEQGVRWEWFLTQLSLSEPALFYVRLLFGSGDMIRLGGMRAEFMYWLRAQSIKAINEALGDPKRACSDGLILAVGRIAMHEHMYGDRIASVAIHRPAQKRMIEMRGGMKRLEFPELVKRLMRWSDQVMAVGTNTERMLDDDVQNPNFTLRESVGAIEKWAPQEMSSG